MYFTMSEDILIIISITCMLLYMGVYVYSIIYYNIIVFIVKMFHFPKTLYFNDYTSM